MPAYVTKSIPMTYLLDYGDHLNRIEDALEQVRKAPPTLLHVCLDFAYYPYYGPSDFRGRIAAQPTPLPHLDARTAKERRQRTRKWTDGLHAAGVRMEVIG